VSARSRFPKAMREEFSGFFAVPCSDCSVILKPVWRKRTDARLLEEEGFPFGPIDRAAIADRIARVVNAELRKRGRG
jgi:hypothetical protein